ncbi:MAG: hypothetical protein HY234_12140 [Acidobacteria bacterium]|nr:hypothetical protein [Acidobacteriota bacterium]
MRQVLATRYGSQSDIQREVLNELVELGLGALALGFEIGEFLPQCIQARFLTVELRGVALEDLKSRGLRLLDTDAGQAEGVQGEE